MMEASSKPGGDLAPQRAGDHRVSAGDSTADEAATPPSSPLRSAACSAGARSDQASCSHRPHPGRSARALLMRPCAATSNLHGEKTHGHVVESLSQQHNTLLPTRATACRRARPGSRRWLRAASEGSSRRTSPPPVQVAKHTPASSGESLAQARPRRAPCRRRGSRERGRRLLGAAASSARARLGQLAPDWVLARPVVGLQHASATN